MEPTPPRRTAPTPPPRPPHTAAPSPLLAMARPSVAHRRWRAHRVVLAIADRLTQPRLWVSGACRLRLAGGAVQPLAVVSDADPPVDGVLDAACARLVVQAAGDARPPAVWRAAGADAVWRLHPDRAEITDADGPRTLLAPCRLTAGVLARPLPWPLPAGEASGAGR